MLSKIDLKAPFRSLVPGTFMTGATFGKRTVIYGHNGSGKSSLAELLYQLGAGQCPVVVSWSDDNGQRTTIAPGANPHPATLSVFTKSWVQDNLAGFLDGESAESIVVLGSDAVQAKNDETKFKKHLDELKEKLPKIQKDYSDAEKATERLVRSVQDSVVNTLRNADHNKYTKNRYNARKVRELLEAESSECSDKETYDQNLEELDRGPLDSFNLKTPQMPDWTLFAEEITQVLRKGVDSQLISGLIGKSELQSWLETGLTLHKDESSCLFCENTLFERRLQELHNHFDDSRRLLQAEVKELISRIQNLQERLEEWEAQIPKTSDVYPDLHNDFVSARLVEDNSLKVVKEFLSTLNELLRKKHDMPEKCLSPSISIPSETVGGKISNVISRHDEIAKGAEKRQSTTAAAVFNYLIASQSSVFRGVHNDEQTKHSIYTELHSDIRHYEKLIHETRAKQFSSAHMAEQITQDLASIYGKDHLTIETSQDGQSYFCRRDGEPARHLSEGERNILALIYFLRLLEDTEEDIAPLNRVVVIDDPSSSLDREAIFATHSWLLDVLQGYGQSIILTHDFEMLRLLLSSQQNQLNSHRKMLGNASSTKAQQEETFPRVSFLEMRSKRSDSYGRHSVLEPISEVLLKHNSEYHYLFDQVLSGIENPDDHDTLFLLPNAARRLLEVFASFHAPNLPNFLEQMKKLAIEDSNNKYRDVYDFCNRFSHGETGETQKFLDVHMTQHQIRRCIEFLKEIDGEHYANMCHATDRKNNDPLAA